VTVLFNGRRAADLMRACALDAIVATSPVNVTYLSGYRNRLEVETRDFMLTPAGGNGRAFRSYAVAALGRDRPALVLHGLFAAGAVDLGATAYPFGRVEFDFAHGRRGGGKLTRALEAGEWPSPEPALAAALRDHGVEGGRVGIEMTGLTASERRRLPAGLPGVELCDCTVLLRFLRAVKTRGEVALLRKAAQTAERAAWGTLEGASEDATLDELAARFASLLAEDGAEPEHFAFSPRGTGIAMHSNATLRNEVAYLDFGCIRRQVRSDTGLTVAFRPPERKLVERFQVLAETVATGAENLTPGTPTSTVWKAMRATVDGTSVVTSPQGHGLGLEAREYPLVGPGSRRGRLRDGCIELPSDLALEAGMVVNLEAATFLPGVASLHVEHSFVVGARGAQPLLSESLDRLLVLPAVRRRAAAADRSNKRKAS
jgi:Xaa-Pro aminopeptidase